MDYDLKGRRALVTGSSRGIGSAIALELARGGADVIVNYSSTKEKAEDISRQIREMGRESRTISADLCDPEAVLELARECGPVDILVLNASVQIQKPWEEVTFEDYKKQMNCNYFASLVLSQKMAPYMKKQHWGRIVAIGSVQEAKPHKEMIVYSSSKCAQTGMVRSLAGQLAPFGITVNSVAPGVIYTDRNLKALQNKDYAKIVTDSIPAGFYGEKEDIAGTVRMLCSDFGRYITGQSIYIDGGKSL